MGKWDIKIQQMASYIYTSIIMEGWIEHGNWIIAQHQNAPVKILIKILSIYWI